MTQFFKITTSTSDMPLHEHLSIQDAMHIINGLEKHYRAQGFAVGRVPGVLVVEPFETRNGKKVTLAPITWNVKSH